jgi:hypothetical protein
LRFFELTSNFEPQLATRIHDTLLESQIASNEEKIGGDFFGEPKKSDEVYSQEYLLRELGHFGTASRTDSTHHVSAFCGLFHRCLIIRYGFLFFTFYTKHFSQ